MVKKNFNKVIKPICAALAVIVATSCFSTTADASSALRRANNRLSSKMIFKAVNDNTAETLNNIAEIVSAMSVDEGFTSFKIGDYVSAYNVDSQETFFLYPVYCENTLTYVAHADVDGNVAVTNNITAYESILSLKNNSNYLIYVDNGTYFASDLSNTVELYNDNYVITDEGINFEGMSFYDKLEIMNEDSASSFEEYNTASLDNISLNSSVLVDADSTQGFWDWWFGGESGGSSNKGETVTKKCAVKKFLLQGNYGLCWACTVGTIVDFKLNKQLEGKDVANMMGIGYDDGATTDEIRVALGKYGLSYKTYNSKLPFSQIQSNIDNDRPFAICMQASNAGHAITGYGYAYNTANTSSSASTNLVYAWDSNGYQISFAQNASTISTSGYRFRWYSSVY